MVGMLPRCDQSVTETSNHSKALMLNAIQARDPVIGEKVKIWVGRIRAGWASLWKVGRSEFNLFVVFKRLSYGLEVEYSKLCVFCRYRQKNDNIALEIKHNLADNLADKECLCELWNIYLSFSLPKNMCVCARFVGSTLHHPSFYRPTV